MVLNGPSFCDSSKHLDVSWQPHHSNDYTFKLFIFFLHTLDFADFTFNVIDVGALIFSGETVEVCENVKMQ